MPRHPLLQQRHQLRLHELVVVRDIQTHHLLAGQVSLEPLGQLRAVPFFHHADDVSPFNLVRAQRAISVRRQAGGICFYARYGGEDLLGGGAAQSVAAADEEYAWHGGSYIQGLNKKSCQRRWYLRWQLLLR